MPNQFTFFYFKQHLFAKLVLGLYLLLQTTFAFAQIDASLFIPRSSPFWDQFTEFAQSAAVDIDLKLTVYNAENSTIKMVEQVKQAAENKTQAILFINYGGVGEPILNIAEQHKIPALLMNTPLNDQRLKPREYYSYWIGSITPNNKLLKTKEKLGPSGAFFDGAQAVIMIYDYLNDKDFIDETLTFDSSMMVTNKQQITPLKKILDAPKTIKYKSLSKAYNPKIQRYNFSLSNITRKYDFEVNNANIGLTQSEIIWAKQHPIIEIGVDGNWPPIDFFNDDNDFLGITAEYLNEVSQLLGIKFIPIKSANFKTMLSKVISGELKVGASISYKKERAENLYFSKPFFKAQKVIIAKSSALNIHDITSLYGKTVAIEDGFLTMRQLQKKHPKIKLMPFTSTLDALRAVSFAKADAYIGNQAVATWLSQKNQLSNLSTVGDPELGSGPQNFAVSKTAPDWLPLISLLNKALDSIPNSRKHEIERKWLGQLKEPLTTQIDLQLTEDEKAWIKQHPTISLGVDAAWKPLEFIDDQGLYQGVSSDFMAYFSQQIGVEFTPPEKFTWEQVVEQLKTKSIDIAPLLTKTEKRSEFLHFTKPYLEFPAVIFNRKGHVLLNGLPDLIGKKLGVVKGYAISELIARDYPNINQVYYTSTSEGLNALSTGQIDAYIDMLAVGGYLMTSTGLSNIQVAASVPYTEGNKFRIGVRDDWPELVSILNKAISQLPEQKKAEILKKWVVVNFQQNINYSLVFWVLGIAIVIFIILTLRSREIQKMNDKLQLANSEVERSNQFKSQFLANMSHEIRTPMNAIVGIGHLLSQTQLSSKQVNYINTLQKSAQSLLSLIDDILDFSKIESGHLNIEIIEFSLEELLHDLTDITTHRITNKNLEFIYQLSPDVPLTLKGDPFRIHQVLLNLVSNSIKFTHNGHIILNIQTIKKTEKEIWLKFEVSDTGIGINPQKLKKLFLAFEQEDNSTTRKYGGTGLGLSISQQLTELMGGSIEANSIKGVGSQFSFKLPFELVTSTTKIIQKPSPDLLGLNILLVDDNAQALDILSQMLRAMAFNVNCATSGEDALKQLSQPENKIDLVLLDWRMPDMDGEETAHKINKLFAPADTPLIIMMTAYGRDAVEQKINQLPIDGFLIKPLTPSLLFDAMIQAHSSKYKTPVPPSIAQSMGIKELRGNILLAEDNLINQQVAKEILEQMGLKVWICENGVKVLEMLKTKTPDLILMDIQMPEMDGYETTLHIKKNPKTKNIPVIAMTANAMTEDRERSLEVGMQAHINKPVDPVKLFKELSQYLDLNIPKASLGVAKQTTLTSWPDKVPGLNIRQGIKQVGGNEALYQKLLKDFLDKHGDLSNNVLKHLQGGDLKQAAREVHTIKGVAGNIGAKALHNIATKIDAQLKLQSPVSNELLNTLSEACDQLCSSLKMLVYRNEAISKEPQANDVDFELTIEVLLQALRENNAKSLGYFHSATILLQNKISMTQLKEIESLIEDYEYEDAYERLSINLNLTE